MSDDEAVAVGGPAHSTCLFIFDHVCSRRMGHGSLFISLSPPDISFPFRYRGSDRGI